MTTQLIPSDRQNIDTSRFERVDGKLVERSFPNETHADVQYAVTTLLRRQAKELGCKALQEWTLDEGGQSTHNWMTPDVLVASDDQPRASSKHLLPPALLAVEILSPGQSIQEMRLKALRYFKWGVANVWIIDPEQKAAVTLRVDQPGEGIMVFDGLLTAGEFRVGIAEIFQFEM